MRTRGARGYDGNSSNYAGVVERQTQQTYVGSQSEARSSLVPTTKICWAYARAGSSPATGTILKIGAFVTNQGYGKSAVWWAVSKDLGAKRQKLNGIENQPIIGLGKRTL